MLQSANVHFEFAGWNIEGLKGRRDKGTFSPGGRFSLGRMTAGSGYCIGIVVESRGGIKTSKIDGGNGLTDVWIVGEPFFRDAQVAFDVRYTQDVRELYSQFVVEREESRHAKSIE